MTPCSWCEAETGRTSKPGTSHGICQRHKAQVLAECDTLARDIAMTFKENERSREYAPLPVVCNDDLDAYIAKSPSKALRDVAIGFVAGALLLTLAVLAFHAL
jgi:hypothetical protein